jgi:hypothetical protein
MAGGARLLLAPVVPGRNGGFTMGSMGGHEGQAGDADRGEDCRGTAGRAKRSATWVMPVNNPEKEITYHVSIFANPFHLRLDIGRGPYSSRRWGRPEPKGRTMPTRYVLARIALGEVLGAVLW